MPIVGRAQAEQRSGPQHREEREMRVRQALSVPLPAPLACPEDSRPLLPANMPVRAQTVRALQGLVGNRALQPLRRAPLAPDAVQVQQHLSGGVVARTDPQAAAPTTPEAALPAAETRAGTPAGSWPQPTEQQRAEIDAHIQASAWDSAVQAMWSALRGSLPRAGQVDMETTAALGVVDGESIVPAGGGAAVTLTYVRHRDACNGLSPEAHRQLHAGEALRFLVQVSPGACRPPAEGVAKLHSTLVHEYVHVEQLAARGVMSSTNFLLKSNDREFFTQRGPGSAVEQRLAALDEIDAYCSEIENAERTGLANAYELHVPIDNVWDCYRSYFTAVSRQPDPAIATRVYRGIQNGRRLFRRYLRSPAAAWLRGRQQFTFDRTPPGYDASMLQPFAARPAAATTP